MLFTLFPWLCFALVSENERKYTTVAADAFNLPPTLHPKLILSPSSQPFSKQVSKAVQELRWSLTCVRSCAMRRDGDAHWNRQPGIANTRSAPSALPASLQARPVYRTEPEKSVTKKGWGRMLLLNTTKRPILEERSACFLGIGTRRKFGVQSVCFLLDSWLRNNHFWVNHVPMHCHHHHLLYKHQCYIHFKDCWKTISEYISLLIGWYNSSKYNSITGYSFGNMHSRSITDEIVAKGSIKRIKP